MNYLNKSLSAALKQSLVKFNLKTYHIQILFFFKCEPVIHTQCYEVDRQRPK